LLWSELLEYADVLTMYGDSSLLVCIPYVGLRQKVRIGSNAFFCPHSQPTIRYVSYFFYTRVNIIGITRVFVPTSWRQNSLLRALPVPGSNTLHTAYIHDILAQRSPHIRTKLDPFCILRVLCCVAHISLQRHNSETIKHPTLYNKGVPQSPVCNSYLKRRTATNESEEDHRKRVRRVQRREVVRQVANKMSRIEPRRGRAYLGKVLCFGRKNERGGDKEGEEWCRPVTVTQIGREWEVDVGEAVKEERRYEGDRKRVK
jgi:hypothetical protein